MIIDLALISLKILFGLTCVYLFYTRLIKMYYKKWYYER